MTTKAYFSLMLQVSGELAVALFPCLKRKPCLGHYYSHDKEKIVMSMALSTSAQKSFMLLYSHTITQSKSHGQADIYGWEGGKWEEEPQTPSNEKQVDDGH